MPRAFAELSFTPSVLALQERHGSANSYAKFLEPDADRGDRLGPREADFVARMDGFFQATVSETGWPYVQFRGGPHGFLKILDDRTIAYADFRGNRQYLSMGNLTDNNHIALILVDYPNQKRLKVWGRAKLVDLEDDPDLVEQLQDESYKARPERVVVITIEALDWNCPQHIPKRLTLEELESQLEPVREEIARLKQENEKLKTALGHTH